MINHQKKCIFVEVPKTGSSSVRAILGEPEVPHLNLYQMASKVSPEQFSAYFKFGFVRNPWDRAVSLYNRREGIQLRDRLSFPEFVDWMKFASATSVYPVPHRYQLDWFVNTNGIVIADFIGRFERINEDWRQIAARLGVNPELPRANVSNRPRKHYSEYFDDRTRRIVAERFAVDIEYFGYGFEG